MVLAASIKPLFTIHPSNLSLMMANIGRFIIGSEGFLSRNTGAMSGMILRFLVATDKHLMLKRSQKHAIDDSLQKDTSGRENHTAGLPRELFTRTCQWLLRSTLLSLTRKATTMAKKCGYTLITRMSVRCLRERRGHGLLK